MAEQPHPDDLAQLRAQLAAQQTQITALQADRRHTRRHRFPRRSLPLAVVALLVALLPLSLLAANPFNDLTGGVHDPNIDAIYNAGITTGCDPNVSYCPTGLVTRQEMASFLARTAGLGTNPPVANAKTAQTADTATTASHASTADSATNATNAGDANTLGGYAPSGLVRAARGTGTGAASTSTYVPILTIAIQAPAAGFVIVTAGANGTSTGLGTSTCPCEGHVRLLHIQRATSAPGGQAVNIPSFSDLAADEDSTSISYAFPVDAGANTFQLQGNRERGTATIVYFGHGSALFVPFGEGGGATITEQGEPTPPPAKP